MSSPRQVIELVAEDLSFAAWKAPVNREKSSRDKLKEQRQAATTIKA
jgi:hypothetical protein